MYTTKAAVELGARRNRPSVFDNKCNTWLFGVIFISCGITVLVGIFGIYYYCKYQAVSKKLASCERELKRMFTAAKRLLSTQEFVKEREKSRGPKPQPAAGISMLKNMQTARPRNFGDFHTPVGKPATADAKDPNYFSLRGLGDDVFDNKRVAGDATIEEKEDKNVEYEVVGGDGGKKEEKAPSKKGKSERRSKKVDVPNPHYEAVGAAEEQNLIVGKEPVKECVAPKRTPFKRPEPVKVEAKNPQYETFADIGDDIFKKGKNEG